jgi:type II secretory pathway pseudopilin PulG
MELMVVVIIVAILAALAIPTMIKARDDRLAYNDAASVMQMFRQARLRAVGRGAAVAVQLTAAAGTDRGTFMMYEAVTDNPVTTGGTPGATGSEAYPFSSCTNADWTGTLTTTSFRKTIEGLNLNGVREQDIQLQSSITAHYIDSGGTDTTTTTSVAWLCFTPTGRVYVSVGAANPTFGGTTTFVDLVVQVARPVGIKRNVLVPPTGMARLYSR